MMKRTLKILFGSIALIWLATGCSQIYDDSKGICNKEQPVSIIATIDNGNLRAYVPLRDNNVTVNENGLITEWKPESVDPEDYEQTIAHVFLFVYKKGEETPHKTIFYYPANSTSPLSTINTSVEQRELDASGTTANSIQMDLELYSGSYNFVLLVNSKAALEKIKNGDTISNPEKLVEDNDILTSDDLQGGNRKYLPMVGQSELYVPSGRVGSETNRLPLVPDIKLERVHARVEFILTTEGDDGKYLSPILPLSKVTSLTLENEQKKYTVMPSDKDYTVTGGGQTKPLRATALTVSTLMDRKEANYSKGANNSEGKIDLFKDRMLPYDSTNPMLKKYIYVAPSTLATAENECLALLFKVKFVNDSEDTVYKIPLTNMGDALTGTQKFITRRNTIYRINAKLIGRDLTVLDYKVINWTNQDVDIPW